MRKRKTQRGGRKKPLKQGRESLSIYMMPEKQQQKIRKRSSALKNGECLIAVDHAAIDAIQLHFKQNRVKALGTLMTALASENSSSRSWRSNVFVLKIKRKPIHLLIYKQRMWNENAYVVFISLKNRFFITSPGEILDKLASQAIVDALGDP